MIITRVLTVGAVLVLAAASAVSQSVPASGDAASTAAVSPPESCRRSAARHDHGADRGFPMPLSSACASRATPVKPAARANPGPLHDHGKFHKNQ